MRENIWQNNKQIFNRIIIIYEKNYVFKDLKKYIIYQNIFFKFLFKSN